MEQKIEGANPYAVSKQNNIKDGVKAFVVFNNKILWVLRDNHPNIPWPNIWNLPGGGIEKGESHEQALTRELQEEVNLTPKNYTYLGKYVYPEGHYVARFVVRLDQEEHDCLKLLSEGQDMRFFTLDEILVQPITPNTKNYLALYKNILELVISEDKIILPEEIGLTP